jgi:GNAT superfamily N-acetyltransferase
MEIRPGHVSDLEAINAVWYATQVAGEPDPPPPRQNPWFAHVLTTGSMALAFSDGKLLGFAGWRQLGSSMVLTDCYVHPRSQGRGIGSRLLAEAQHEITLSSGDPKALSIYVAAGMVPRWPAYYLRGAPNRIALPPGVSAVDNPDLIEHTFPIDASFLLHDLGATGLAIVRHGSPIGVAVVASRTPFWLWHGEDAAVLQSVAYAEADAWAVVAAAAGWPQGDGVEIQVPGLHPALPQLLEAGFRVEDHDTLMAAPGVALPNPSLRTFSGDLFG